MTKHIVNPKPHTSSVKLSDHTREEVRAYSKLTGIPQIDIRSEAVADWMETVGAARMEIAVEQAQHATA